MKRVATLLAAAAALLALLTVAAPQQAEAKDMTGRFGLGADSSLGFYTVPAPGPTDPATTFGQPVPFKIPGLSAIFQISEVVGVQLIGSFQVTSASNASGGATFDYSIFTWGLAVRGIFAVGLTDDVNLGVVAGFGFIGRSASEGSTNAVDLSALHFSGEVGLRPEWFITNFFSIHTQVGITLSLLNEDNSGYSDSGFNLNFFQNVDLIGNAGFTFWF